MRERFTENTEHHGICQRLLLEARARRGPSDSIRNLDIAGMNRRRARNYDGPFQVERLAIQRPDAGEYLLRFEELVDISDPYQRPCPRNWYACVVLEKSKYVVPSKIEGLVVECVPFHRAQTHF